MRASGRKFSGGRLAAFGQARIEVAHTRHSSRLDMDEVGAVATTHGLRVDAVDGRLRWDVAQQARCRIDLQRRADDEEEIRLFGGFDSRDHLRHLFAKPDDEGAELRAIGR